MGSEEKHSELFWNRSDKMTKTIKKLLIFYIPETFITLFLFYWLFYLSNEAGNTETTVRTGFAGTFLTLGILAYTFGLRHAFDADHLAAIDNSTRKLVQEQKPSNFTGLFFSLGHSTVVILLSIALIISTREISSNLPALKDAGTIVGTFVSGTFLYVIGLLNFFILITIYKLYGEAKNGSIDEDELNETLMKRGFFGRYFDRLFKFVNKQYHLYPIGFLFGLGFDTASETALLAITAGASSVFLKVPLWYILVFPFLFTAGMTLVDTSDGFFMNGAYSWAFSGHPLKKIWYNLTMTLISILISFMVGNLEILGLIQSEFNLNGSVWDTLAIIDGIGWGYLGIIIVVTFILTWASSYLIFKIKIEKQPYEQHR